MGSATVKPPTLPKGMLRQKNTSRVSAGIHDRERPTIYSFPELSEAETLLRNFSVACMMIE